MNLLANAITYSRPDGSVRLAVSSDAQRVQVSVADSGPGIEPAVLDGLFVPFERPATDGSGTGLGLALCKRLVDLMAGTITVQSALGEGSTFHVSLQRSDGPGRDATHVAEPTPAPAPAPTVTVLHIEDNLANLRLVEQLFAPASNIELLPAARGRLGLQLAHAHRPDLILLDLYLPDMTGEDVATALRADQATRAIPIIVLTANAHPTQRRRLLALGVDAYITTPFNANEITTLITQLLPP